MSNENLPLPARILRAITGANVRSYNPTEAMVRNQASQKRQLSQASHDIALQKKLYETRTRQNDKQGAKEALLNYFQAIKNKQRLQTGE